MNLSPDLLAQIQAAIASGQLQLPANGATNLAGRSPFRPRQLHDLTLLPTKDDPRPTFNWSADPPRDDGGESRRTFPYPRLLWMADGTEITVHSEAEHRGMVAQGYLEQAPGDVVIDQTAQLQAMLDALSPADRALVVDGKRQARVKAALDLAMSLPDAESDRVIESLEATAAKAKRSA
jgi:hypothetical protein